MPWKPSTDFEEEIVNLQPDHDFIFGALSEPEPQPFYPRPQSHIEYAATKKRQQRKQQDEYEATGRWCNDRLHVIAQVQRIARTKALGEQPTVADWDNDKDAEKEVVAMMRHFGLGPSVEQPLNEKLTIATFPVKKGIEVMKNGRKKVPLFFDDNVFKLKPRVSNSSSGFESSDSSNSPTHIENKRDKNDASLNVSSSSCDTNSNSFHTTANDLNVSNASTKVSLSNYEKAQADRHTLLLQAERMHQYDKLNEEDVDFDDEEYGIGFSSQQSSFSLNSSYEQDSFKTALNENVSRTTESLFSPYAKAFIPSSMERNTITSNSTTNDNHSFDDHSNSSFTSSSDISIARPTPWLQCFIKSDTLDESRATSATSCSLASSSSSSSPILPPSYASIAKKPFSENAAQISSYQKISTTSSSSTIIKPPQLHFYTAREVYERNRRALQ